jgi:hypothetical protein
LNLSADLFLDFFEGLEFGFGGIVLVEGVAAADETVAGGGGAIAEGAADEFFVESAFGNGLGEDGGVAEGDAAKCHHVGPALTDKGLGDVGEEFLGVTVGATEDLRKK